MDIENEKLTERLLLDKGMWSSKTLWKAVSGVAIAVFVITMIYAKFVSMGKDIIFLEASHKIEMSTLTDRQEKQNARHVKEMDDMEDKLALFANELILLKLDAHEPAPGQKRIHR
jgi:hypothetical protein